MKFFITAILALFSMSTSVMAAEHVIGQKNKAFTKKSITIKKGDTIKFPNQDPFFHNVYSMSESKSFDLGSYAKGVSKSVKFDKQGEVIVQCAIHPFMKLKVKVE
ncbi:MAG: plastocyanin/azurin family copper-binding protein [Cellvibrionaceae bacterium]|nr:plastocyanin/azurin family copper-binding protein [Cellvibrionaceae bacterium]